MGVYGIWPVIKARPPKIQDPNVEGLENKSRGSRNNKVWRPDSFFHLIYGILAHTIISLTRQHFKMKYSDRVLKVFMSGFKHIIFPEIFHATA